MKNKSNNRGYSLVEFIISIAIVCCILLFFLWIPLFKCNFFYTESGVLKRIQVEDNNAVSVLYSTRNLWSFSEITIQMSDQSKKKFLLDTNILFNYRLMPAE